MSNFWRCSSCGETNAAWQMIGSGADAFWEWKMRCGHCYQERYPSVHCSLCGKGTRTGQLFFTGEFCAANANTLLVCEACRRRVLVCGSCTRWDERAAECHLCAPGMVPLRMREVLRRDEDEWCVEHYYFRSERVKELWGKRRAELGLPKDLVCYREVKRGGREKAEEDEDE